MLNHIQKRWKEVLLCATLSLLATPAVWAHGEGMDLKNVAHIQATEAVSVKQDWLTVTLSTTVSDAKAKQAQKKLIAAVNAAFKKANAKAEDGKMEVSSGNMNLYFNQNASKKSMLTDGSWRGSAQVILQGSDFDRILSVAEDIDTLTVQHLQFGLSPQLQRKAAEQAQELAIKAFGKEAQKVSQSFGFGKYSIREVTISKQDAAQPVQMEAAAFRSSGLSAQEGKQSVSAHVGGSIQMQ